ncbi:MAG: DUF484 family protein [Gammaproteobacteria bacterium]|nr:DUF484 family protein [Gammaproteobacteria bacterium]
MTRTGKPVADDDPALERQFADYLRAHPDFFNRFPDLVRDLSSPHSPGDAISLVERQLSALRTDNRKLQQQLQDLVHRAQANESLNSRIHELALELLRQSGPQAVFKTLRDRLRSGFRADSVAIWLFAEPGYIDAPRTAEFAGRQSSRRGPFASMIDAAHPLCGRLNRMQGAALFDSEEFQGSAVVLPLRGRHWDGLLGIRSNDPVRFDPDMGTEMLLFLAEIAALIIEPWIAAGKKR